MISSDLRMMPTRSFIESCSSSCKVYGFSAAAPFVGVWKGASARFAAVSTASSETFGRLLNAPT